MKKLSLVLVGIFTAAAVSATMVEYVEDGYAVQAPKEITDLVEEAAAITDFGKPYEVVVPKKAGLHINPWNRFISSAVNPISKNWFMVVNPEWLLTLPRDQQLFWISRCFMQGKMGIVPPITKYIAWLFVIVSLIMLYGIYCLLGRTRMSRQRTVVRIALAFGIACVLEVTVTDKLQSAVLRYLYRKHDTAVNIATIEKTGDRNVAIQALQAYTQGLKKSIENGEQSFVPFQAVFENMIQALKTQD